MKEAVRAIITNEDGDVLLGKRARGVGAGLYALIGGKPDPEETPEDAIGREVQEEIGLDFTPTALWRKEIDEISDPVEPWLVYFFTGPASGKLHLKKNEVAAIVYVSPDNLSEYNIAFNHTRILSEFFESRG